MQTVSGGKEGYRRRKVYENYKVKPQDALQLSHDGTNRRLRTGNDQQNPRQCEAPLVLNKGKSAEG